MKLHDTSLRSRLTTLVIIAIFGAVGIVTASSVWRETAQYSASKFAELDGAGAVFASAVAKEVRENDKPGALEALRAIAKLPTVKHVRIEKADGSTFAELGDAAVLARGATRCDACDARSLPPDDANRGREGANRR